MPLRSRTPQPGGFTLIELLVVVAVLSAASLLAFGVFSEDRTQIRYDDTRQRLQVLRRAILGQNGPSTAAEGAAGFVADNGDLPADLITLLQLGTLQARAARSPIFDPKPDDTTCANDGSADDISLVATAPASAPNVFAPAAQLVKGHGGDYLGGLSVNGRFRDGWGNVSSTDDSSNFGWSTVFDGTSKTLAVTSLGLDNAVGPVGATDFAADFGLAVAANDWLVPIAGWTVTVKFSGMEIPANRLSLSLLVFINNASGGQWLRYATNALSTCLGTNSGCTTSATLSFTDGCKPGESVLNKGRIPQGRHLLLVSYNGTSTVPWATGDTLTVAGTSATGTPANYGPILTQVDAVAGRNLPAVTLEIR